MRSSASAARASPGATEASAKNRVRVTGSTPPCALPSLWKRRFSVPTAASTSSATRAIADSCERAVAPASAPPPPPARGSRSLLETDGVPGGPPPFSPSRAPSAPCDAAAVALAESRSARTNAVSVSGSRSPGASTARHASRYARLAAPFAARGSNSRAANDAASTRRIAFSFSAHSFPAAASAERSTSHSLASARPPSFCVQRSSGSNGSGGSERPEALTAFDGPRSGGDVPPFRSRAHSAATEFRFPSKSAPRDARAYASRVDARTPSPGALAPSGPAVPLAARRRASAASARRRAGFGEGSTREGEGPAEAPSEEAPRTDRAAPAAAARTAEASLLFSDAVASCMAALYEA